MSSSDSVTEGSPAVCTSARLLVRDSQRPNRSTKCAVDKSGDGVKSPDECRCDSSACRPHSFVGSLAAQVVETSTDEPDTDGVGRPDDGRRQHGPDPARGGHVRREPHGQTHQEVRGDPERDDDAGE